MCLYIIALALASVTAVYACHYMSPDADPRARSYVCPLYRVLLTYSYDDNRHTSIADGMNQVYVSRVMLLKAWPEPLARVRLVQQRLIPARQGVIA